MSDERVEGSYWLAVVCGQVRLMHEYKSLFIVTKSWIALRHPVSRNITFLHTVVTNAARPDAFANYQNQMSSIQLPETRSYNTPQRTLSSKATPSTSYAPRQLNVLLHDRDTFRVNGTQIRVFEQMNEKCFRGFL